MQSGIACFKDLDHFRHAGLRRVAFRMLVLPVLFGLLGAGPGFGQVRIEIQNLAGVSEASLEEMVSSGRRAFRLAEIATRWEVMEGAQVHETTSSRERSRVAGAGYGDTRSVRLRLVTSRHTFSGNPACLGESLVVDGGGSLAIVYVDRVRAFAARNRLPLGRALAYAAAHEVGHLLLGDASHAPSGLMRASWNRHDAEAMRAGTLVLGEATAERMQRGIPMPDPLYAARISAR